MERPDARRAEELANLKLALAAFALQLDAFEARLKRRQIKVNAEPSLLPDSRFAREVLAAMKNRLSAQDRTPPRLASLSTLGRPDTPRC